MSGTLAWFGFGFFVIFALRDALPLLTRNSLPLTSIRFRQNQMQNIRKQLLHFEQILRTGDSNEIHRRLSELEKLPPPWGSSLGTVLGELRSSGQSLVPTVKRFSGLLDRQSFAIGQSMQSVGSSLAQAGLFSMISPLVTYALVQVLSRSQAQSTELVLVGLGCWVWSLFWMSRIVVLVDRALNGGVSNGSQRIHSLLAIGESWLALVRSGVPPDLAWTKSWGLAGRMDLQVAKIWGASPWEEEGKGQVMGFPDVQALKRAVGASVMEGRPCLDRGSELLLAVEVAWDHRVIERVGRLGVISLAPLFLGVIPAAVGQLGYGIWITSIQNWVVL